MKTVLGIDIGGTYTKIVIATADGTVRHSMLFRSEVEAGPGSTIDRILNAATRLKLEWPIEAVGIGICGPVDRVAGELIESPVLPGWSNVQISAPVREAIGCPVIVENDSNCAILGEWWLGAGERMEVVAGLTLGTGVGGGLVLDGDIFVGGTGWGAEFGHISVADGPPCGCGGTGCLNVVASATATARRYSALGGGAVEGTEDLVCRQLSGDLVAAEALFVTVKYLIVGVRMLVNVLNPNVFILAGGMSSWGNHLRNFLQDGLSGSTFDGLARTPIRVASLGMYSGALGAARLAQGIIVSG